VQDAHGKGAGATGGIEDAAVAQSMGKAAGLGFGEIMLSLGGGEETADAIL